MIHIAFTIWEVLPHSYGSNRKDNSKKSENVDLKFLMMVCQYQLMNTFLVIWGKSVFRSTGVYQVLNVSRNLNLNFAEILCSPQYWILWHFTLTSAQNVILTKVQYPLTCMFQINISNFISQGQNPKMEAFQNFVFPY